MSQREQVRQQVTQADIEYADSLLKQGSPLETVREKLIARGLSPRDAGAVAYNRARVIYAEAANLLSRGLSSEEAVHALTSSGFSGQAASAVVNEVSAVYNRAAARRAARRAVSVRLAVPAMVLGGLVFTIGGGLWLGNVTGLFPTVPYAGYTTIAVGFAVFGWGAEHISK